MPPTSADLHPVPFPIHMPRPTPAQVRKRALRTLSVAGRHFAPLGFAKLRGRAVSDTAFARPLRLTFEELGATYMKFGQLIGSAPGVFGDEVAAEFRSCLDTGPSVDFETVQMTIENTLGRRLDDVFEAFEQEPIAAASIAVVHRGVLRDGRTVAVKVLRPGIEDTVAADLDLMEPLMELLARQIGMEFAGRLLDLLGGFREQVSEELDLRNEARTTEHYLRLLAGVDLPLVTVPRPYPELSGRQVLVMEFLEGTPIDDLAAIERHGIDPKPLVKQVVQGWFITALRNGTFHGDVHAGNLMLLNDGRVGVLDWGIVGRLDTGTHFFFRRLIQGALGEEAAWDDIVAHITRTFGEEAKALLGLSDEQFAAFVRAQVEPILTKPFGEVSLATLLMEPADLARAEGEAASNRSVLEIVRRWRERRERRSRSKAMGFADSDFDRGMFLLGKQLMYFERYGKMFLSDEPILADRDFFEKVLAEEPLVLDAPGNGTSAEADI